MVAPRTLSSQLSRLLLAHLKDEETLLKHVETIIEGFRKQAGQPEQFENQRFKLAEVVEVLGSFEQQRQTLLLAISQAWGCLPDQVRLSQLVLNDQQSHFVFHQYRNDLRQRSLAVCTELTVQQQAIRGLSRIVSETLAMLFHQDSPVEARYTAEGQRQYSRCSHRADSRS